MADNFTQVRLRLTNDADVLKTLRRNKALREPNTPNEHMVLQFDAREFKFFKGKDVVVPFPVAQGLYQASGVIVGDPVNGDLKPGLEKMAQWELGATQSKTACSVCGEDQGTLKALREHLTIHDEEDEAKEE